MISDIFLGILTIALIALVLVVAIPLTIGAATIAIAHPVATIVVLVTSFLVGKGVKKYILPLMKG